MALSASKGKVAITNGNCLEPKAGLPVDVVVLRVEVKDDCDISDDFLFITSAKGMAANPEVPSPQMLTRLTGERQLHDIKIETYSQAVSSPSTTGCPSATGSSSTVSSTRPSQDSTDKLPFFSGIPSVEVIKGLLHLYKPSRSRSTSSKPSPDSSPKLRSDSSGTPGSDSSHKRGSDSTHKTSSDSSPLSSDAGGQVLCMLNVPADVMLSDVLGFLSPVLSSVAKLQVVRDSTPNQYMLLLIFKDKVSAQQFYLDFHGKPFSSLETSVCCLVRVLKVEVMKTSQGASMPSPDFTELPSCPVCLERLDESVLTILCNHSFHMQCLTRWEDSTCPICRYTQTPEPCTENVCNSCDSKEDLWICLICGHVGCGRYVGGHAQLHYLETQHTFSMQLGRTQRVWDYIGDNYVHRLVQNKEDGKLVEVATQSQQLPGDQKIDSLQLEYSYLLSSQLETQRLFFEEKMALIEKDLTEQLKVVEDRCRVAVSKKEELEGKISDLEKEKKGSDKRSSQLQSRVTKLSAELKEEKEMNKCLSSNQKLWRDRVEGLEQKIDTVVREKEQEMKEMQEQVRDLMFYLETKKKVEESPNSTRQELQEGQLVVPATAPAASSVTPRKTRKKK